MFFYLLDLILRSFLSSDFSCPRIQLPSMAALKSINLHGYRSAIRMLAEGDTHQHGSTGVIRRDIECGFELNHLLDCPSYPSSREIRLGYDFHGAHAIPASPLRSLSLTWRC